MPRKVGLKMGKKEKKWWLAIFIIFLVGVPLVYGFMARQQSVYYPLSITQSSSYGGGDGDITVPDLPAWVFVMYAWYQQVNPIVSEYDYIVSTDGTNFWVKHGCNNTVYLNSTDCGTTLQTLLQLNVPKNIYFKNGNYVINQSTSPTSNIIITGDSNVTISLTANLLFSNVENVTIQNIRFTYDNTAYIILRYADKNINFKDCIFKSNNVTNTQLFEINGYINNLTQVSFQNCIFNASAGISTFVSVRLTNENVSNVLFRDNTFFGGKYPLIIAGSNTVIVDNCKFIADNNTHYAMTVSAQAYQIKILDSKFDNYLPAGSLWGGTIVINNCTQITIRGNRIIGGYMGIRISGVTIMSVTENTFIDCKDDNTYYGMLTVQCGYGDSRSITISNNLFEFTRNINSLARNCLVISGEQSLSYFMEDITVTANAFRNLGFANVSDGTSIYLHGYNNTIRNVIDITIIGNVIDGELPFLRAIRVNYAQWVSIVGNAISNINETAIYLSNSANGTCVGNIVNKTSLLDNTSSAILLSDAQDWVVESNTISSNGYGIRETGASDYNIILGNDARNCVNTSIVTVGANTIKEHNLEHA